MFKKITLLFLIISIVSFGFAQKSKRKTSLSPPKNSYFEITINGETTPAERYCPNDSLLFDFIVIDPIIADLSYCWHFDFYQDFICDETPIKRDFPINLLNPNNSIYRVALSFKNSNDSIITSDTVYVKIDYIREENEVEVCQGRDIEIINSFGETIKYTDVQSDIYTPWDTVSSGFSGCDSIILVRWHIKMKPYVLKEHAISSCDSVTWEEYIIKKPAVMNGDTTYILERIFPSNSLEPCCNCDTLKKLSVTIIDTAKLQIEFDQDDFCSRDDMGGTMTLETNFTAFDWTYKDTDSTWTVLQDKSIEIELPGTYHVLAYMDTSLYDTLKNLRIVNCFKEADTTVTDCLLIIPNVITPNGDGHNDIFGIKKLNPVRKNELTIYDRWGKVVFSQKNYKCIYKKDKYVNIEDAFDGLSRGGQKLPEGTYYYAFRYYAIPKGGTHPEGKTYTGTLTILR
jgi:gliding motility-associated-like protein